jgi:hypothetical protein
MGNRELAQFRWFMVWLMPIPVVVLIVAASAFLLKHLLHETWVRILVGAISVGTYAVSSWLLRRALPAIEEAANLKDGRVPPNE